MMTGETDWANACIVKPVRYPGDLLSVVDFLTYWLARVVLIDIWGGV